MLAKPAAARTQIILAFAAVYIIWGSTYLFIRFADATMPPFLMAGTRFLIAGLILYLWLRVRGAERPRLIHWRTALIVGGLLLVFGNGIVSWAELHVPSGLAALLVGAVPLWMALLDWLRPGGTRPNALTAGGVVIGFAGVALLATQGATSSRGSANVAGIIALLGAAICWAAGSLYSRTAPFPKTQLLGTGMEMIAGGVVLLILATVTGEWGQLDLGAVSLKSALSLGFLIVFGSLVAFSAYVWLLRHVSAARASTYAYVNPVVAVFLGWAFAHEPITPITLISTAIIVTAVAVITAARARAVQPAVESTAEDRLPASQEAVVRH